MNPEDKMTIAERYKYLRQMQKRYKAGSQQEKKGLLDEMEAVTGQHRKSLIRLKGRKIERQPRRQQRGKSYGVEVDDALRVIAESCDHVCAERLQPNLVWLAEHLAAHGELEVTAGLLEQLATLSVSSIQRRLQRLHQDEPRLPRPGPVQANQVRRAIPTRRIPWDEQIPGHFEVDPSATLRTGLVHHSGPSTSGAYVHTLQLIDVSTGWSERAAVLGRSYLVMVDSFRRIESRLPIPILELHPDNGSEFLNAHLIRYWRDLVKDVHISRSRPYQKNDNRFVEQKNQTLVRVYLGHERLDTVQQTLALNHLYDLMWLYYNFFQPVLRLQEKTAHFSSENAASPTIRRKFDLAKTPYDRLRTTKTLSPETQQLLDALRAQTNPRQLRQHIYCAIDQLFALPCAAPNQSQNVHLTLNFNSPFSTNTMASQPDSLPSIPPPQFTPSLHLLYPIPAQTQILTPTNAEFFAF